MDDEERDELEAKALAAWDVYRDLPRSHALRRQWDYYYSLVPKDCAADFVAWCAAQQAINRKQRMDAALAKSLKSKRC